MARQKGIIKLSGTIGDINFYTVNGKSYARKAGGGFNGKAIKTKESMQRVRENGSEFGHCSAVKKKLLQAFQPYTLKRERGFHGKCMSMFLKLKSLDQFSKRGQRRVDKGLQTLEGKRVFKDFTFGKPMEFLDVMVHQWRFDEPGQRLELPAFIRSNFDDFTAVTEIKFSLFLIDFNFEKLEYKKHSLDEKRLVMQEENPPVVLFPASVISVNHTPIFYVGIELINEVSDKKNVVAMRIV